MSYKYLLFDLDGTITESDEGIINSIQYALGKVGVEVNDVDELRKFIGPPFHVTLRHYLGFEEDKITQTMKYYRERFSSVGIYENKLYEGIDTLIEKLYNDGKVILLATSKPEVFAKRILDYFKIAQYFTFVGGSNLDYTRSKKSEVIEYVLSSANIKDKENAVMIGDRMHDIEGAKETGLKCIGVAYGYGGYDELVEYKADYIAKTVDEIEQFVI